MNKLIFTFCLIVASVVVTFAQDNPIQADLKSKVKLALKNIASDPTDFRDPVSINLSMVWSEDRKQLALIMKVNIEPQWHIYAFVPPSEPYIETELRLDLPEGLKPIGDWELPQGQPYDGGVMLYKGNPVFIQYCSVDALPKNKEVEMGLRYQACDIHKCLIPTTKTKTLKL